MHRKLLWKAMLDADFNALYWEKMVGRYTQQEFRLKMFVAASTTLTSGGLVAGESWVWFSRGASLAATVAAIYLSVRNHTKRIEEMIQVRKSWLELLTKYELLWNRGMSEGYSQKIDKDYEKHRLAQDQVTLKESKLPKDEKMRKQCQNEVMRRRNIKN